MTPSIKSKKNLVIIAVLFFAVFLLLALRLGYIQIVKGEEYSEFALTQQTRDIPIKAERGAIYDRNGDELAVSVTCYTIWIRPGDVATSKKKAERIEEIENTIDTLADILKMKKKDVEKVVTSDSRLLKLKTGVDSDTADKIRKSELSGIEIVQDTKRQYTYGAFASHVLGTVSADNSGLSGLELEYNSYLSGVEGRWVNYTDNNGNELVYSYDDERHYSAQDGLSIVTTLDHGIQYYTERALEKVMRKTRADRAFSIVMDVETGEILALAQVPDFDLNDPMEPANDSEKEAFKQMSDSKQTTYLNKMWRNALICDVYEPGSTFKLLTTSIALEEDKVSLKSHFNCSGSLTVAGETIRCWAYPNAHGYQSLREAVSNSCNPVFMRLAGRIGISKFYEYLDTFGINDYTNVDFPGEAKAILQSKEDAGPVGLATIGFGQGVAVTPVELITAVSSLGNGGKLMQPRLVKELKDSDGKTVQTFEPKIVRQTVSEETAKDMCKIMEFVVSNGGAAAAAVDGYKVGAKTGTANKATSHGYSSNTYSSCIAMAPIDDPKIAVLVIVDSPKGIKFGSVTAAPGVHDILENSLTYLHIAPTSTATSSKKKVKVPDVVGMNVSDAIGKLTGRGLDYDTDKKAAEKKDFIVLKQYPAAGSKVKKGTKVYLYKD